MSQASFHALPPTLCFSETSVDFQWIAWFYFPEDGTLAVE
jgi:hypothetical protein